jgi:hypothetical protein
MSASLFQRIPALAVRQIEIDCRIVLQRCCLGRLVLGATNHVDTVLGQAYRGFLARKRVSFPNSYTEQLI